MRQRDGIKTPQRSLLARIFPTSHTDLEAVPELNLVVGAVLELGPDLLHVEVLLHGGLHAGVQAPEQQQDGGGDLEQKISRIGLDG